MATRIESLILEGVLRPGEKLASERDLAEKLEVSRPTLRDAIAKLVDRGLLTSTRGGTFVAKFLDPLMTPLANLLSGKPDVTDDYFEFRRCVEAEASGLAAKRATDIDRQAISDCIERMTKAHSIDDPSEEAEVDAELHMAIYEASHNVVVLHVMRAMSELLRREVFYNREQLYLRTGVRDLLLGQHTAIAEAVIAGRAEEAKAAAAEHMRFTYGTITEIRRSSLRMEASLHRVGRKDFLASDS
ncbi:MAG: FCD domain-containing protein [bacterium]|nr:FCD domain-containing protein [bacterium]